MKKIGRRDIILDAEDRVIIADSGAAPNYKVFLNGEEIHDVKIIVRKGREV